MKRWPLYAAIAYVVLLFAGLFVLPAAPEATASGAELVRYYREHGDAIRVVTWLSTLSTIPIVLLLSHLRSRLTGMSRDVMLFGAVGLVVPTMVWSWFNAGLALHANSLDPSAARTVADVGLYFGPMLTVSIVLLITPIGLAVWRGEGGFPRWLAWITLVFAVEQSIETITVMGRRGFIAPGGPMNFMLGAGLFAVWVIAAGRGDVRYQYLGPWVVARRIPLALRALLAAIALPGVIVYVIPWLLAGSDRSPLDADWWRWLGLPFIALGVIGLASSIVEFARRRRGTLAPIDPPSLLVRGGLYNVTRNPMYCANVAALGGQAVVYGSAAVAVYAIVMTFAFHAFVVLYEEPALRRAFGPSWDEYARRVPRWVGVRSTSR